MDHSFCGTCQAPIIWAETPAGERIPVDVTPVKTGKHILVQRNDGRPPLFRYIEKAAHRFGRNDLRVSHFATCPDADEHRNKKPSAPKGFWLIAKTPADQPYPCLCHNRQFGCMRNSAKSHCLCNGRAVEDHLPRACCARPRNRTEIT